MNEYKSTYKRTFDNIQVSKSINNKPKSEEKNIILTLVKKCIYRILVVKNVFIEFWLP